MDDYAKANPENYYYLDVYSTVSFMEKMFKNVDNGQKNYDLLGGWICHSPLQEEARSRYVKEALVNEEIMQEGSKTVGEILLLDNFRFVAESICDVTFVEKYYASQGKKVILELEDTVGEGENPFLVYRIVEN